MASPPFNDKEFIARIIRAVVSAETIYTPLFMVSGDKMDPRRVIPAEIPVKEELSWNSISVNP